MTKHSEGDGGRGEKPVSFEMTLFFLAQASLNVQAFWVKSWSKFCTVESRRDTWKGVKRCTNCVEGGEMNRSTSSFQVFCTASPNKMWLHLHNLKSKFLLWKEKDNESVIIKIDASLLRGRRSSPSPSKPKHSTAFHRRPCWTHRRGYTAPLWPPRNTARNVSSLSTEDVYSEQISAGTSRKL